MPDRRDRLGVLRKIPAFARLDHRHFLNEDGKLPHLQKLPRNKRRILIKESNRISRRYKQILSELYNTGLGFPLDQTVRQMAAEYTNRYAYACVESQPSSFVFFEPFFEVKMIERSLAPFMSLRAESNNIFNVPDFFDFYTSNNCLGDTISRLLAVRESHVFYFNNNGDLEDFTITDAKNREYIISGFCFVRHGNLVNWALIAGELLSKDEWDLRQADPASIELDDLLPYKRAFLQECIQRSGSTVGRPLKLEGSETAVRTIIAGEFDLGLERHVGRIILEETENAYTVHTDDPEVLEGIPSYRERNKWAQHATERLKEASALWSVSEALFSLPTYFESRVTVSHFLSKNGKDVGGLKSKGGNGIKGRYQAVEAVVVDDAAPHASIKRVEVPHFNVSTDGYWRSLPPGAAGKDRDGNTVKNKTWIHKPNVRKNGRFSEPVIYVKDRIALAKIKIEKLYLSESLAPSQSESDTSSDDRGVVYVLRCAAMDGEVYKVGWTSGTANERAGQLSAASGVPQAFIPVKVWRHDRPRELETEIHVQLAPYRINENREFFKLSLSSIEKIIEATIARIS